MSADSDLKACGSNKRSPQCHSGVQVWPVLFQIITDTEAGQTNFIRNLPELLFPAICQMSLRRDFTGDAERRSPQFLGKPEKMLTNIIIRDAIERIQ